MIYSVSEDPNKIGNGDVSIVTDNGTLVALVYAQHQRNKTAEIAAIIANALNAAFAPSMTDLMVEPKNLDDFVRNNPLPSDGKIY